MPHRDPPLAPVQLPPSKRDADLADLWAWFVALVPARLWTRRCRGCADPSPHDSHLTWLGRRALGLPRRSQ